MIYYFYCNSFILYLASFFLFIEVHLLENSHKSTTVIKFFNGISIHQILYINIVLLSLRLIKVERIFLINVDLKDTYYYLYMRKL